MKVITIEELEKLAPGEATIVDVRPEEEFRRGTFEGAINIPMKEFSDRMDEIPKDKPVWLLCHTGERSVEYVELLCLSGKIYFRRRHHEGKNQKNRAEPH